MIAEVGEISTQIRGITYSQGDAIHSFQEDYVPILRANNITEEGLNFDDLIYVPKKIIKDYQLLRMGDVLIAASSGSKHIVGKAALVKSDICSSFGAFCKVLRPNKNIDFGYFSYYFQTPDYRKRISELSAGANINNLKNENLNKLKIPLPPLETQKKITAILDKADELRQNDKKILAKYDQLAQSVFLEMFGDPVLNSKNWQSEKLINMVTMKGGGTPSKRVPEYFTGSIPWVSPKDMKFDFITTSIDKITEEAIQNSSTCLIEPDSVLLVIRSGILKNYFPIAINKVPVTINQDMKALKCKDDLNPYFLMFQLRNQSGQILQTVRGTTADNISSNVIKEINLILPPIVLQNRFSEIIKHIEIQKQLAQQSIQKSEDLFQSLLQRAFRGELA
jgi:type I restriction enzyme, S subunit